MYTFTSASVVSVILVVAHTVYLSYEGCTPRVEQHKQALQGKVNVVNKVASGTYLRTSRCSTSGIKHTVDNNMYLHMWRFISFVPVGTPG